MRKILQFVPIILATVFFLNSCKKNNVDEQYQATVHPVLPDLSTQINASVAGFITDENGAGVEGAVVAKGSRTTLTDAYGYFKLDGVDFVKSAGFINVSKQGYFTEQHPKPGPEKFINRNLHVGCLHPGRRIDYEAICKIIPDRFGRKTQGDV